MPHARRADGLIPHGPDRSLHSHSAPLTPPKNAAADHRWNPQVRAGSRRRGCSGKALSPSRAWVCFGSHASAARYHDAASSGLPRSARADPDANGRRHHGGRASACSLRADISAIPLFSSSARARSRQGLLGAIEPPQDHAALVDRLRPVGVGRDGAIEAVPALRRRVHRPDRAGPDGRAGRGGPARPRGRPRPRCGAPPGRPVSGSTPPGARRGGLPAPVLGRLPARVRLRPRRPA